MDHDLGVGFGAEAVTVGLERLLQLTVVLDDAVQHDREPRIVATGERVGVLLVDGAVRGPAGVSQSVVRTRAVRSGDVSQELEVADRPDVFETAVFTKREAR